MFIITVVSFNRYDFGGLIPYIFYPMIIAALSETPHSMLMKRCAVALPFCMFIGLSNALMERTAALTVGGVVISYGLISFGVIVYRAYLCVTAILLLVSVTAFTDLTAQLRRMRLPLQFVILLEMVYRYIGVLIGEAASMRVSYSLRNPTVKGVDIRHAGSFIGCLLLRSFDRAERIYAAMKCRGYPSTTQKAHGRPWLGADILFCVAICSLCILFRFIRIDAIASLVVGGLT